jgi:hypothetical protein
MTLPLSHKRGLIYLGVLILSLIPLSSCVTSQQDLLYVNDQLVALSVTGRLRLELILIKSKEKYRFSQGI